MHWRTSISQLISLIQVEARAWIEGSLIYLPNSQMAMPTSLVRLCSQVCETTSLFKAQWVLHRPLLGCLWQLCFQNRADVFNHSHIPHSLKAPPLYLSASPCSITPDQPIRGEGQAQVEFKGSKGRRGSLLKVMRPGERREMGFLDMAASSHGDVCSHPKLTTCRILALCEIFCSQHPRSNRK